MGEAYIKAGLRDDYVDLLQPWKDMLNEGLTTFAEVPGHARSDCHPWGCSPLYEFYATICGISPGRCRSRILNIMPAMNHLKWIKASLPHCGGSIALSLQTQGATGIAGQITLPPNQYAHFNWRGKVNLLHPGRNTISYR